MFNNFLKVLMVLGSATSMASTVTRITATFSLATNEPTPEVSAKYLVVSKKDLDPAPSRRPVQEELELLSIGPDSDFPQYEVAKTSKLLLISPLGPNDGPVPTTLKGVLPNGKSFEATLEKKSSTEEEKPDGTLLATYCGKNDSPGIPEDSQVKEVCIETAESKKVE